MAKITKYTDIPLDSLVIGKGQVRTTNPGKGIDELARSIAKLGLLQPIVVCQAGKGRDKWEILTGQRRFLAHKALKRTTIAAAIVDERVDEEEAKAISITENLMREKLTGKELKDGVLFLYKRYGTIKDVTEATGLPRDKVSACVKYPRLVPELRELVDDNTVDVNVAVSAQDAATDDREQVNVDDAVKLATEMAAMTGAQRKKVVVERRRNPDRPVDDVIEESKSGAKVIQIVATVTASTHRAVQAFAKEEGTNQDQAVASLIEEALVDRGLLTE